MHLVIAFCFLLVSTLLFGCGEEESFVTQRRDYFYMNTDGQLCVTYKIGEEEKVDSLHSSIASLLYSAESSLSATRETSYVYKFNQASAGEKVKIDKISYDVLKIAKEMYAFTDGYYNPAVKLSVDLYKPFDKLEYASGDKRMLPAEAKTTAFCELASHFNELAIEEDNGRYYATKPEYTVTVDGKLYSMEIDLGGIGKGWCVEQISALIDNVGIAYGYFNFGSSSFAIKQHPTTDGNLYSVSLRNPRGDGNETFCSFSVKNENLSTSGDYEQYFVLDGVRYCHIINPYTGKPIETNIASATVVGGSAAESDALTTALSAMGKEKAVQFINEKLSDRAVIFLVLENGNNNVITNRSDLITITGEDFAIANTVADGKILCL